MTEKKILKLGNEYKEIPFDDPEDKIVLIRTNPIISIRDAPKKEIGKYGKLSDRARLSINDLERIKCDAEDMLWESAELKRTTDTKKQDVRKSIKDIMRKTHM